MAVDHVNWWSATAGLNADAVVYRGQNFEDNLRLQLSYFRKGGDMKLGTPSDFGNDGIGTEAGATSIISTLGNEAVAVTAANRFRFGIGNLAMFFIEPMLGVFWSGQTNTNRSGANPNPVDNTLKAHFLAFLTFGLDFENLFPKK